MNVTSAGPRQGIAQNFAFGLFPFVKEASNVGGSVPAKLFALFFVLVLFLRLMVWVVE